MKTDLPPFPPVLRAALYRRLDDVFARDVRDKAQLAKWPALRERAYTALVAMACYVPVLLVMALGMEIMRDHEKEFILFNFAMLAAVVGGYVVLAWNSRVLLACLLFRISRR